jgi:hypothetical protein
LLFFTVRKVPNVAYDFRQKSDNFNIYSAFFFGFPNGCLLRSLSKVNRLLINPLLTPS